MIRIIIDGEELDLPKGFSITIEETSPVWNDMGSQSVTASVPATQKNRRLLGHPGRTDALIGPADRTPRCMVQSGAYIRSGKLNITGANDKTIDFNIGFDNSEAYADWKSKRLQDLRNLPSRTFSSMEEIRQFADNIYSTAKPQESDLAIFPVCLSKSTAKEDDKETTYHEIINDMGGNLFTEGRTVTRVMDNAATEVSVPAGYGCTPFLRVWRILELIFADLGLKTDGNPFKEDADLARLVVMNNTADTICAKTLKYRELLPDCTVEDFLQAMWVRFGLVYHTDFSTGRASLRLMRDLMADTPVGEFEEYLTAPPSVEYSERKYLALSAGTSIEGAEPLTERLEDFLKGFDLGNMVVTYNGNGIYRVESTEDLKLTGVRFTWIESTGTWRRDTITQERGKQEESNSFFKWDPSTSGMSAEELTSTDECVPLENLDGYGVIPMMLTGSRHYHTAIDNSDEEEESDCPICLMFAFTDHASAPGATIGRLGPDHTHYGAAGGMQFLDGSDHTTSLYFQFSDGLFAKFWKEYDELLRHSGRTFNINARMDACALMNADMMRKTRLQGTPVFPDTMSYTLGSTGDPTGEMTFISAITQGGYDIEREQNIPRFPPSWD